MPKKEIIEMEKKIRQLEKDISTLSGEALESAMESYSRLTDRFEKANGYAWKSEITGVLRELGFDESQFTTPSIPFPVVENPCRIKPYSLNAPGSDFTR